MKSYFYHSSIRSYIVAFMNVFNNIKVRHGAPGSPGYRETKVPIQFLPKEKFIEEYLDSNRKANPSVEKILPRITVDMTQPSYDAARKTNTLNRNVVTSGDSYLSQLNPVPYNFDFQLNIFTRYGDELFQIVEQIIPFFQPSFNITIKEMPTMGITERDIPIVLNSVSIGTEYVGERSERRRLESKLEFTLKGWIYPDITNYSNVIKKVIVDFGDQDATQELETIIHTVDPWDTTLEDYTIDDNYTKTGISDTFTGADDDLIYPGLWSQIAAQVPLPVINDNKAVMPIPSTSPATYTSAAAVANNIFLPAPKGAWIEAVFDISEMVDPDFMYISLRANQIFQNYTVEVYADGSIKVGYVSSVFDPLNIMWLFPAGTYTSGDKLTVEIDGYAITGSPVGTLSVYLNNVLQVSVPLSGPVNAGGSPSYPGAPTTGAGKTNDNPDRKRMLFGISGTTGKVNSIRLGPL